MTLRPHLAVLSLVIALTACSDDDPCPAGTVPMGEGCVAVDVDAGGTDAGPAPQDAGADGGETDPCLEACADDEICRSDGSCVECTAEIPCDTGHCELTGGTCVDCTDDEHCPDPAAPTCGADNICAAGCASNAECGGRFPDTHPYCDEESGRCVECTVTNLCSDGETCNLTSGECVDVAPGSVAQECGGCTNDRQCAGDRLCIPLSFDGVPHGAHCLRPYTTCTQPFAVRLRDRTSINGASAADYCGIDEELTTCDAAVAFSMFRTCGDAMPCPEGGLCRQVGALADRCTIPCTAADQCIQPGNGETCGGGTGTTDDPAYCGG